MRWKGPAPAPRTNLSSSLFLSWVEEGELAFSREEI